MMDFSAPRSLKHDYDLYVENEIELYKDSISRTVLLKIGDEAVASLQAQPQFAMNELLLCDEVDKIIRKRQRIPTYATWRKREVKRRAEQAEFLRPEHWGVSADSPLVREVRPLPWSHVLVAGAEGTSAARYLAAQGCSVTAISANASEHDLLDPADEKMIAGRIASVEGGLKEWAPDEMLSAVVCTPAAFAGLTAAERSEVFAILQSATHDGGVHLVDTLIQNHAEPSLSELRRNYKGWTISVVDQGTSSRSFLARKEVA